jgi:hypothetical protein
MLVSIGSSLPGHHVVVVQGRDAVLSYSSRLEQLAHRCGQSGAMHWLHYFLTGRDARGKRPFLVLFLRKAVREDQIVADDLHAAVLLMEYRLLGLRTRAFTTDDAAGFRTVIAPERQRSALAMRAAEVLLDHGAHVVMTSHTGPEPAEAGTEPRVRPGEIRWARRERIFQTDLHLEDSVDGTLARFGKRTRCNMRYYRRRLEAATGCVLVPDASRHLSEEDVLALNSASLNPVAPEECLLRFRSGCDLPGGFVVGLRAADGGWLSLAGGWRQGGTSVLHWQMNIAGHEKQSINTAMRLFLIEHEVERGTALLKMYGGTPHSMGHALVPDQVWDLVVERRSWRTRALRRLSALFASPRGITRRTNFLAETLRSPELEWRVAHPGPGRPEIVMPKLSVRKAAGSRKPPVAWPGRTDWHEPEGKGRRAI